MASISPTSVQCSAEPFTDKHSYIKLTITSISDSDAATNKRYIGWKLTVEGTSWVQLSAYYCSLGGKLLAEKYTNTLSWTSGQVLASNTTTFDNDSAGNLSLYAYVKQLFYYGYNADRWSNPNRYQEAGATMVCSQLPRYANFTSHYVSGTTINTLSGQWGADSNCDVAQYSLNGGSWTNCSYPNYTIGGLSPNTEYNVRTRIKRADSQLWTTSGYIYGTTAKLPASNTPGNINLGSKPSISIANTTHLSKWYYKIYDGNTEIYSSPDITSTSHNAVIDSSSIINGMLNRHPNDNSWSLSVRFWVVSNGTTYELTQRSFTCTIPSGQYSPSFNTNNISYVVTDSLSNNITGSNQKVIKGISDIRVTCTAASPQGGSNMKSYNATSGSKTASTTNLSSIIMDLEDVDGSSVTVQAVDTRNRTTNATKSFAQYVEYSKVNISTSNITRYDGIGQNLVFNIIGSFYKWSGLAINNAIQAIQYQYKLKGQPDSSYSSPIDITGVTYNDNVFTINSVGSGNYFDTDKEYTVKISITDRLTTVSYTLDIPTGRALVWKDLQNYRIGIGKKPNNALDVNGDISLDGALYLSGNGMVTQHAAGYYTDTYGNFTHKRTTSGDILQFLNNSQTKSINIDWENASINADGKVNGHNLKVISDFSSYGNNFDNITETGLYGIKASLANVANTPTKDYLGILMVMNTDQVGTAFQIYIPDAQTNHIWKRRLAANQPWYDISAGNLLYQNDNGSDGNITINDNISNYSYIDIIYVIPQDDPNQEAHWMNQRVPAGIGRTINLNCCVTNTRWSFMGFESAIYYFTDQRTFTRKRAGNAHMYNNSSNNWSNSSGIKITRIIGYR